MKRRLILDTDIDTDCDDAGALAVLHALMHSGECDLMGVICSVPVHACVGAVRAINGGYGRPKIPVGIVKVDDYATSPAWRPYREHRRQFQRPTAQADPYNEILAATRSGDDSVPEAAVRLYRRLLAASPDGSVSICAIGTLTALAQLLRSRPDDVSRLPGRELVARKVRELTSMAAVQFSEGHEAFNWRMDGASAAAVLEGWPTAMTMSPRGDSVLTGARFIASAGPGQPVREAYVRYLGGVGRSRPSWDLIAALYAVRGLAGPFALSASRKLKFDPASAKYGWGELAAPTAPPRRLLEPILADAALAGMLEELMIASLEKACPHRTRRRR